MKKITLLLTTTLLALQANSFTITERVKVKNTKPVYKTIIKKVPHQECWDESVPVRRNHRNYNSDYPIGTIIGGVAGGVIGHQVGGGRGKDLATVGGAIIGSIVGHNISKNQRRDSYRTYETRQKCVTKYNESNEERFIGYKNIGYYKGQKITKISDRRLRYIPVTIRINY